MSVKWSHYLWIMLAYLLGNVGGGLLVGLLWLIWQTFDLAVFTILMGVSVWLGGLLLSSVVVARLGSTRRIVACYMCLIPLLQIVMLTLILALIASQDFLISALPHMAHPIRSYAGSGSMWWFIIPAIAYYFATRQRRIEIPV